MQRAVQGGVLWPGGASPRGHPGAHDSHLPDGQQRDQVISSPMPRSHLHALPRPGFRLSWLTHDCGGRVSQEGEIRWQPGHQEEYLSLSPPGPPSTPAATSTTATAPGTSRPQRTGSSRSSQSRLSCSPHPGVAHIGLTSWTWRPALVVAMTMWPSLREDSSMTPTCWVRRAFRGHKLIYPALLLFLSAF